MAEQWAKDAVLGELTVAREASETRTMNDLRTAIGVGHEDLQAAITELGDEGKVSEVAPAEYTLLDTNAAAREAAAAAADVEEPGISLAEAERQLDRAGPVKMTGHIAGDSTRRTILSGGVAKALDAAALGQIVKAGIDEALETGDAFVFEVVP